MKRKRTDSGGSGGGASGNMNAVGGDRGDVRLSGEMQALMRGRKYVKESELTRQVLLEYAKQKGAVELVELVRVKVEQFGGSSFVAVLDDTESKVRELKRAIEDKQGVLRRFQALFPCWAMTARRQAMYRWPATLRCPTRAVLCFAW